MWIGDPALSGGINDVDNTCAVAAGLALRPVIQTIRDTLAWNLARGGPGQEGLGRRRGPAAPLASGSLTPSLERKHFLAAGSKFALMTFRENTLGVFSRL